MDCSQVQQNIDDYLDGQLPAGEGRLLERHVQDCPDCKTHTLQIQTLRQALRSLPVPPPTPDFQQRLFQHTRITHTHKQRQRRLAGLGAAIAASVVLMVGIIMIRYDSSPPGIETIVMGVSDTREVNLVFNSPENFKHVTLSLDLTDNLQLRGYGNKKQLVWQTAIKKGPNHLTLPITAVGHGQAKVIARLKHGGKIQTFKIPLLIRGNGAQLNNADNSVSV